MPPKRKTAASKVKASTGSQAQEPDYSKLTVAQLKSECQTQGLDASGKKADLLSRLQGGVSSVKKSKPDDEAGKDDIKTKIQALKAADKGKSHSAKVDKSCPIANTSDVHEEYDCMLNQTNIGHNNNKYYVIQVLQCGPDYYSWNRWGRVGESGQNALKGPSALKAAISDFKKKFKDKTKNNWDDRDNFNPVPGKYTLIEMDDDDEEDNAQLQAKLQALDENDSAQVPEPQKKTKPCTLGKETQEFINLILADDTFKHAMHTFNIDVKKMPLGKLSKTQIAKGFECLDEIEDALNTKKGKSVLECLSSKFYTLIPHAFGRNVPPAIADADTLRKKMDMLLVLGDIELAQAMQKETQTKGKKKVEALDPHPLDVKYKMLNAELNRLDKNHKEFKVIETYVRNTEAASWYGGNKNVGIQSVWKLDRFGEDDRFSAHDNLKNRKLLWHGTNVAVVAAILKTGLRIMPHSGGRVGRGMYFASEHSKSAGYVGRTNKNIGMMFLVEVALGKEHHITLDDSSLKCAPNGTDSVIAKGQQEPDPSADVTLTMDGKKVTVPQGKPIKTKENSSRFSQSEYLVYKESQARLRYILQLQW